MASLLKSRNFKHAMIPLGLVAFFIVSYAAAYRFMGVEKHFDITEEQRNKPWFASFYISSMALSNAMGDATPKTIPGRTVFMAQTLTGWLILMLLGDFMSQVN